MILIFQIWNTQPSNANYAAKKVAGKASDAKNTLKPLYSGGFTQTAVDGSSFAWAGPTASTVSVEYTTDKNILDESVVVRENYTSPYKSTSWQSSTQNFTMETRSRWHKNGGHTGGGTSVNNYIARIKLTFSNPVPANEIFIRIYDMDNRGVDAEVPDGSITFGGSTAKPADFEQLAMNPAVPSNATSSTYDNTDGSINFGVGATDDDRNKYLALAGKNNKTVSSISIFIRNIGDDVGFEVGWIDPSTSVIFCAANMGGTVYNDPDGASNGVNGSKIDGTKTPLYVSLVKNGSIMETQKIQSDGSYLFIGYGSGNYQLVLTTNPNGSTSSIIPAGSSYVAEGGAVNATSGYAQGDGAPNGLIDVSLDCNGNLKLDFGIVPAPFPVTLVSFTGTNTADGVTLEWKTSLEKNFDRFEIEQSFSPTISFVKLGVVAGGKSSYRFVDNTERVGVSYYRLKMIDTDGSYSYSRIISVEKETSKLYYSVFPNPSKGKTIYVLSDAKIDEYQVFDILGNMMTVEMRCEGNLHVFNFTRNPAPGLYLIRYTVNNKVVSNKFIISD